MKELDENDVYDLPIHDSDFLGANILQGDNGETDLLLSVAFCKGEFEELSADYLKIIKTDGSVSFIFKNCERINIRTICNRTQRDEIDYIQFRHDDPSLKEGQKHVEVTFISGSKLECISDKIALT